MSDRPFSIHLSIVWTAQGCFGALLVTRFCTWGSGGCQLSWMGLQCAEQQVLPWSRPSTCLSNSGDMWVGPSTAGTLCLIDEEGKIFLWPGMEQPGGLPLTFFMCIKWYVWDNVHGRRRETADTWTRRKNGGRELCFSSSRGLGCPKPAEVYGNQTGRGQMKWFGTAADVASARPLFFHSSQRRSTSARLDRWKAPLCRTIN